jgi:hypothetical protein
MVRNQNLLPSYKVYHTFTREKGDATDDDDLLVKRGEKSKLDERPNPREPTVLDQIKCGAR